MKNYLLKENKDLKMANTSYEFKKVQ